MDRVYDYTFKIVVGLSVALILWLFWLPKPTFGADPCYESSYNYLSEDNNGRTFGYPVGTGAGIKITIATSTINEVSFLTCEYSADTFPATTTMWANIIDYPTWTIVATSSVYSTLDLKLVADLSACVAPDDVHSFVFETANLDAGTYVIAIMSDATDGRAYMLSNTANTAVDVVYEVKNGDFAELETDTTATMYYDLGYRTCGFGTTSNVNLDPDLATDAPDFNTIESQVCFLNDTCKLWFSINELDYNYVMYLFNNGETNYPGYEIASTTITYSDIYQNYVVVPDPGSAQLKKYDLLLNAEEFGFLVQTGIKIRWIGTSTFDAYFSEYVYDTICDDIATSSLEWWDPTSYAGAFRYALECGGRKLSYWAFTPSVDSWSGLLETKAQLDNKFPLNFMYQVKNTIMSMVATTSATSTMVLTGLPDDLSGLNNVDVLPLANMPNNVMYPLVQLFREIQVWFIWLFAGIYFIYQFFSLASGSKWSILDWLRGNQNIEPDEYTRRDLTINLRQKPKNGVIDLRYK